MDHDWGDELNSDTECAACGLMYSQWTDPETLWCPGESKARKAQINEWFEGGNN